MEEVSVWCAYQPFLLARARQCYCMASAVLLLS